MIDQNSIARIETQVEATEVGPRGVAERGHRVYFVTAKGERSSVFIANSGYTTDNVRAMVRARAMELDALKGSEV